MCARPLIVAWAEGFAANKSRLPFIVVAAKPAPPAAIQIRLKIEIFDIGSFGYPPRDEDADNPHARGGALQDVGRRAKVCAGRQHVVEKADDLRLPSRLAKL